MEKQETRKAPPVYQFYSPFKRWERYQKNSPGISIFRSLVGKLQQGWMYP